MKALTNHWEELEDGSLRLIYHDLHPNADVLIIPVEIRKPLLSSRVKLCLRNKETGALAEWMDSDTKFTKPRELALSTAISHAIRYRLHPAWLLRIGIDYYEETPIHVKEWEREIYRYGRP